MLLFNVPFGIPAVTVTLTIKTDICFTDVAGRSSVSYKDVIHKLAE